MAYVRSVSAGHFGGGGPSREEEWPQHRSRKTGCHHDGGALHGAGELDGGVLDGTGDRDGGTDDHADGTGDRDGDP
jgi:hypothetical protein